MLMSYLRHVRKVIESIEESKLSEFKTDDVLLDKENLIKEVAVETQNCFLCQKVSGGLGVFFPKDSKKFWGNENKQRVIFYGLCVECSKHPNFADEVELKALLSL